MLVCPQCQSENPDTHKFCQTCGGSLTEKECPTCSASVALDAEYCLHCGTATGTFWKALLCFPQQNTFSQDSSSYSEAAIAPVGKVGVAALHKIRQTTLIDQYLSGQYLDASQRYQILAPLPVELESGEAEVRVLDCQPLQLSPLKICEPGTANGSIHRACSALGIPSIARPYLELQERHPALMMPQVHATWEQGELQIVLLEDRSVLPSLLSFWRDEQVLPIQILHWLHEMVELWAALQTENCCQSLLVLDNLRVDEDSLLCLQRLYPDRPGQPPQLRDLGSLWQTLFQRSQRTQRGDLSQLYSDIEAGIVNSLDQLRARLEDIAAALQPDLPFPPLDSLNPFMIDDETLNGEALFNSKPSDSEKPSLDSKMTLPHLTDPTPPSELKNNLPNALSFPDPSSSAESQLNKPQLESVDEQEAQTPTTPNEDTVTPEGDDSPTVVLPMRLASLEDAGTTDIGRQRDHNEDCFSIQTEIKKIEGSKGRSLQAKGLYILCDGMGGHASGEVASALAVETLQRYFAEHWQDKLPNHESIREAIHQANHAIYDLNQQNSRSGSGRMGTTLVLVLVQDTEAAIAHVGDSRLYRFSRRRGLETVTVDHEVGQREIQRGVEPAIAYARPDAYQLTQALGPRDENFVSPDIRFLELNEDMVLLLCSDGLTDNNLLETHWQSHVEPLLSSQNNLEQGVHQLIELANQQNGHDNITAIAIRAKVRPNLDQFGH
ncbi:MAG TPA: serine/threonine phosphatase [Coleofasciculaceae cyanobacterium]|jgi:protein phosphatase